MESSRLTVVVPVFNGAGYVGEAVASALAQTAVGVEVVVVDDGSTDDTPRVLASFGERIRVVRQANSGLSAARNAGIATACGELLSLLDADDLLPGDYAAAFLAAADTWPQAEVFHCGYRAQDPGGRLLYEQTHPKPLDDDPFHRLVQHGSPHITALVARRRAFEKAGPFDVQLHLQEDWDYWLRLAAAGCAFRAVPATRSLVRRRPDSMSAAVGGALGLTGLAILERHLAAHPRCPACPALVDPGLARWRLATLNSLAREHARRLRLRGGTGLWIGRALALARRPRLFLGLLGAARARTGDA